MRLKAISSKIAHMFVNLILDIDPLSLIAFILNHWVARYHKFLLDKVCIIALLSISLVDII